MHYMLQLANVTGREQREQSHHQLRPIFFWEQQAGGTQTLVPKYVQGTTIHFGVFFPQLGRDKSQPTTEVVTCMHAPQNKEAETDRQTGPIM
jgi:hypothetical protein